jgi:hypothetical protein
MSLLKYVALFLVAGNTLAAGNGAMFGGGIEVDTDDGFSGSLIGSWGFSENTWLSAAVAKSSVELRSGHDLETLYGNLEFDHFFDPVGVRLAVAYWGDSDILESRDWRASLYWRGEKAMLSADYEYRDFELTTPGTDLSPGRRILFDADGLGATLRLDLGKTADLRFSAMKFDYSVPFRPVQDRDVVDLVSVSRLSLINSLDDHRASITFGLDRGLKRWEFDVTTSEGAVAGARTNSYTVRYLVPISDKSEIEIGLGYDDSEVYGEVTFLSLHVFFYGAD